MTWTPVFTALTCTRYHVGVEATLLVSAFIPILRGSFLYLSRQGWLRRWMETSALSKSLTSRFIAGLSLEDGLRVCADLKMQGIRSSLDYLGENVRNLAEAERARDAYLAAQTQIAGAGLNATISMKLTALGLDLSDTACRENTNTLVQKAKESGSLVELDMEDTRYTDRNLAIVREMHARHHSVRAVIQAYLYRSEQDIEDLCRLQIPVRLCKGAYKEPPSLAYPKKADVDRNYLRLMKTLLDRGAYPAIASHDPAILTEALDHVRANGYSPDRFEFQMLYGIQRGLQKQLVDEGYRLRLYVPYGAAWYPYFMRRLAERPANATFLIRQLFRG